jgi:sn-glycerol 3-phosphate transport system permease protein
MLNSLIGVGITLGNQHFAAGRLRHCTSRFRLRIVFFWMIFIIHCPWRSASRLKVARPGFSTPWVDLPPDRLRHQPCSAVFHDGADELCKLTASARRPCFFDILLPMSRTSIAALFVILFIYGWNQYLWPLLITSDQKYYTLLIGIKRMLDVGEGQAEWHIIMAATILAMLPPVLVVIFMQKQFVRGMTETEK